MREIEEMNEDPRSMDIWYNPPSGTFKEREILEAIRPVKDVGAFILIM